MIDENLVTVTNNQSNPIKIDITSNENKINVEFLQSIDSTFAAHNNSKDAHSNIITEIKEDLGNGISAINTRLNDTYSKDEANNLLNQKLGVTDTTITKKGNSFNGSNQLVLLNSNGQIPAIDGSLLTNISGGGVNKYENKGTVTNSITLSADVITTAVFSGAVTITLPTITDTTKQTTCILDFTTTSGSSPTITNTNLKWSDKNNGKAPSAYSIISGVRNILTFKSIWVSGTLYWEAIYSTNGAIDLTFTQPALGSNGILGGASFAVGVFGSYYAGDAFHAFDNNLSTSAVPYNGSGFYIYNPNALKISQLELLQSGGTIIYSWTIYGSNDNSNYTFLASGNNGAGGTIYTPITSGNQGYYKYYKFLAPSSNGSAGFNIAQCNIQATFISA